MFVWPIIALVGILSAVWFLGVRKPGSIGSPDSIRRRISDAYPAFELSETALDTDGTAVLGSDPAGTHLVLMFVLGNQVVSRELSPGLLRDIAIADAGEGRRRVTLQLHDLGCPRVALTLAPQDAERWVPRLERLLSTSIGVR